MQRKWLWIIIFLLSGFKSYAAMDEAQMSVWVNEAIVQTYTFNANNYLQRQRLFAHYFTAKAWMAYIKALNQSKLLELVKKNVYTVSAVATMPPTIKKTRSNQWTATMPLLVSYRNAQLQQKQILEVSLEFTTALENEGVRGLAIESMVAKKSSPPCDCPIP